MPASYERTPNRPLSGLEVAEIIKKDVDLLLSRDGMFNGNIAYQRLSYEVRVSVHMDNPIYPEHVSEIASKTGSKQELEKQPELAAIEPPPLSGDLSDEEVVFSEELHREISSPNMARVEHGMPITVEKRNMQTGHMENREVTYKGDIPDPAEVGNRTSEKNTTEDQRNKWKKGRK